MQLNTDDESHSAITQHPLFPSKSVEKTKPQKRFGLEAPASNRVDKLSGFCSVVWQL